MRRIFLFMMVSLDGYFEGENHDLSWHNTGDEFNEFAEKQLRDIDTILFGRRTYQLMESYWPTEQGQKDDPIVARLMNETKKVVFSKTLTNIEETDVWKNVQLVKENVKEEVEKLKNMPGKDIAVFGSSNLCITLLELGLLDEMRIMINPIIIGRGTPLFYGLKDKHSFHLNNTRQFTNGNILLTYSV